jgi:putative transposase
LPTGSSQTYVRQHVTPDQLTLHADRGTAMTSRAVALLLADLGVTKTHPRPHVSDDNPLASELQDAEVQVDFPERFGELEDARACRARFFELV